MTICIHVQKEMEVIENYANIMSNQGNKSTLSQPKNHTLEPQGLLNTIFPGGDDTPTSKTCSNSDKQNKINILCNKVATQVFW